MTTTPSTTSSSSSLLDELEALEPWTETRGEKLYTALSILAIFITGPAILAISFLLGL